MGAIVFDDGGRLLLVRRANPPAQGLWSIPGGRVEPGEAWEDAVVRELLEETAVPAAVDRFVGEVRRDAPQGEVYVIRDYLMTVPVDAVPRAGDDASAASWFMPQELPSLDTSPGLLEALRGWDLLPD